MVFILYVGIRVFHKENVRLYRNDYRKSSYKIFFIIILKDGYIKIKYYG